MLTGTEYFRSLGHAIRYYLSQGEDPSVVGQKLAENAIKIGRPPKAMVGDRQEVILIDGGTRYAIVDREYLRKREATDE